MRLTYDWDEAYEAAIFETDRSRLEARIGAAWNAINRHVQEMNADHGGSPEERYAVETALAGLDVLRKHAVFQ